MALFQKPATFKQFDITIQERYEHYMFIPYFDKFECDKTQLLIEDIVKKGKRFAALSAEETIGRNFIFYNNERKNIIDNKYVILACAYLTVNGEPETAKRIVFALDKNKKVNVSKVEDKIDFLEEKIEVLLYDFDKKLDIT